MDIDELLKAKREEMLRIAPKHGAYWDDRNQSHLYVRMHSS